MEMARKDRERYQEEMRARDIEALKEQEERRKARESGVLKVRERPSTSRKRRLRPEKGTQLTRKTQLRRK